MMMRCRAMAILASGVVMAMSVGIHASPQSSGAPASPSGGNVDTSQLPWPLVSGVDLLAGEAAFPSSGGQPAVLSTMRREVRRFDFEEGGQGRAFFPNEFY